ncbi:MAG: methyltransferase [Desulfuromonas sp.]|nr:MAG: methyltransferase [Desulfuromonas sp.]
MRKSSVERRIQNAAQSSDCLQVLEFLKTIRSDSRSSCIDLLDKSRSQIRQDLFVLSELNFKKNGYFVEFGATNGLTLSNTYLLEKEFQWDGIVAEPARKWHAELNSNRSCKVETKCVWSKSGEVIKFNETEIGEFSTIDNYSSGDMHSESRKSGVRYDVETISFLDMLETYNAPSEIDYLSIDTEGSEYEILENFDFNRYQFRVITCEHNYTKDRDKIYELLTSNGYKRKFEALSQFDDWYVKF